MRDCWLLYTSRLTGEDVRLWARGLGDLRTQPVSGANPRPANAGSSLYAHPSHRAAGSQVAPITTPTREDSSPGHPRGSGWASPQRHFPDDTLALLNQTGGPVGDSSTPRRPPSRPYPVLFLSRASDIVLCTFYYSLPHGPCTPETSTLRWVPRTGHTGSAEQIRV